MNRVGIASWKTKEDVLQDLGVIGQTRITDDCLVIGSGPPPPLKESNDDEYDLRFGGTSYSDVTAPPDLNGIRQFLSMLNDEDGSADEEPVQNNAEKIVISKLNPLVKEFVPKSSANSQLKVKLSDKRGVGASSPSKSPRVVKSPSKSSKDNNLGTSKKLQKNSLDLKSASHSPKESIKTIPKSPPESVVNTLDSPQKNSVKNQGETEVRIDIDAENEQQDMINKKTNELRNKISETLKSDSPKHKRERNVAIANLLRLHSAKPSPTSSKSNLSTAIGEKEIKLFTPDYFKSTAKNMQVTSSSSSEKCISPEESDNDLENKKQENVKNEVMPVDSSSIQESIEKVKNWLDKPESPQIKSSAVCLGPVSFKRKDANGKSPTGDIISKIPKSNSPVARFKPSQYADDLAKKYLERSKEIERREMSIWESVERELKKKDDIIRKKQAANRHV